MTWTSQQSVWNVITAEKYSFFSVLKAFYFKACTDAGPVDALKVQSSNSNTKISRVQVHLLSEGPTCSLNLSVDVLSFLRISKQ